MLEQNWPEDGWLIACDGCSNEAEFPRASNFDEALTLAKARGWRPRMENGAWIHLCPVCLEEDRTGEFQGPAGTVAP